MRCKCENEIVCDECKKMRDKMKKWVDTGSYPLAVLGIMSGIRDVFPNNLEYQLVSVLENSEINKICYFNYISEIYTEIREEVFLFSSLRYETSEYAMMLYLCQYYGQPTDENNELNEMVNDIINEKINEDKKINDTIKTIIDKTEKEQFNENDAEFYEGISSKEGKRKLYIHYQIERNPKISKMAKKYFIIKHNGRLFCEVCGFDFYETYGDLGDNFIEAHHFEALSKNGEVITNVKSFNMVCSCCHKMLHRKFPCLTIEELRKIVLEQKN